MKLKALHLSFKTNSDSSNIQDNNLGNHTINGSVRNCIKMNFQSNFQMNIFSTKALRYFSVKNVFDIPRHQYLVTFHHRYSDLRLYCQHISCYVKLYIKFWVSDWFQENNIYRKNKSFQLLMNHENFFQWSIQGKCVIQF